jgi:hypothetical protein
MPPQGRINLTLQPPPGGRGEPLRITRGANGVSLTLTSTRRSPDVPHDPPPPRSRNPALPLPGAPGRGATPAGPGGAGGRGPAHALPPQPTDPASSAGADALRPALRQPPAQRRRGAGHALSGARVASDGGWAERHPEAGGGGAVSRRYPHHLGRRGLLAAGPARPQPPAGALPGHRPGGYPGPPHRGDPAAPPPSRPGDHALRPLLADPAQTHLRRRPAPGEPPRE